LLLGPSEEKSLTITVGPLFLDTKLKEHTNGPVHDITDRVFVRPPRISRNDSLPTEPTPPRWLWQLSVDVNGRFADVASDTAVRR